MPHAARQFAARASLEELKDHIGEVDEALICFDVMAIPLEIGEIDQTRAMRRTSRIMRCGSGAIAKSRLSFLD